MVNQYFFARVLLVVSMIIIQPSLVGAEFLGLSNEIAFMFILAIALVLFLVVGYSFTANSIHALLLFAGVSVVLMSISLFRGDVSGYVNSLKIFSQAFFFFLLFNLSKVERLGLFMTRVYVALGLMMLLSVVLAYLGLLNPLGAPFIVDGFKTTWHIGLTLTSTLYDIGGGFLMRPSGPFDEPGRFAMLLILSAMFTLGESKSNAWFFVLILCTMVTTSLAGIVAALFLLVHYLLRERASGQYLTPLSVFIIFTVVLIVFSNLNSGEIYEFLQSKVIDRMEYSPETGFIGNNRHSSMLGGLEMLQQQPLFGYGATYVEGLVGYDRSSIFGLLAQYGLVGTVVYLSPLLVLLAKLSINKSIFLVAAILVLIFARPYIYSFHIYMFLFVWFSMNGILFSRASKRIMD